jgi:hypothetical protein
MDFLMSEQGPRGDVIKKCRQLMNQDKATADALLKILGLDSNSSVRDIYVRHKKLLSKQAIPSVYRPQGKLKQIDLNAVLIQDTNSLMYKNI